MAFLLFNWESSVSNLSINEQVSLFNEAIMNVISSFFLNELVFFDDFDPPWMNCYTKNLIVATNDFYKKFVLPSSNMDNLFMFKNLQNQIIQSIHTAKQNYFNKIIQKLCDTLTSTKCYWSLLKTILNG